MIDDFSGYICGGYFLTKAVKRPKDVSDLIPNLILTLSSCFTDIAPNSWADSAYNYSDDERAAEALKFGIKADDVSSLVNSFTSAISSHHIANAFPALSIAQEFYSRCENRTGIALLGIGLEPSLLPSLYAQRSDDANGGYGLLERIAAKESLAEGGKALGFEPLGFEATKFHSWLCHNAPIEASEKFNILPNMDGFIERFEDAVHVTEDLKRTGAETAIWEPWLIVQYSG